MVREEVVMGRVSAGQRQQAKAARRARRRAAEAPVAHEPVVGPGGGFVCECCGEEADVVIRTVVEMSSGLARLIWGL